MANRFWVGGAGNWSSTAKWSDTSGGAGGFSVPTSADTAIFDANSGGKFIATVDTAQTVGNLSITPAAGAGVLEIAITVSITTGNLTTTGTAGNNRIWFRSSTYGISTNLIVNGTVSISDCDFRGVYVTGTSAPISGTRIGNRGESRGITFDTPKTVYWVSSGSQNVSNDAWAATSGGAASLVNYPLPQDTAVFDNVAAAGTSITFSGVLGYIPTISAASRTLSLTFSFASGTNVCYGNWTNGSGVTISGTSLLTFSGGTTQTITSAGRAFTCPITIDTYGGTVQLFDPLNIGTQTLTVTNGTFSTQNQAITAATLSSSNSNVRTINLGASTITLSGVGPVSFTTSTNLTFNVGTSTIICSSTSINFNGGTSAFYNMSFTGGGTSSSISIAASAFNNLSFTPPSTVGMLTVTFSSNIAISGTFTCAGASVTQRLFVASNTAGTQRTITAGSISANDCDFRDINLAGSASGASPTRAGNCGGNTGITFPAPKTVYWNLAGAQNWSATGWATSSGGAPAANNFPLPQDTAVFDNTGSVTGTITVDRPWNIGTFDASLRTSAMTLTIGANSPSVHGDWKFGTGVTSPSTTGTITFAKNGTTTITSNGVQFGCAVTIDNSSTTVQLADALVLIAARTLTLITGTFDAVTYNVTVGAFSTISGTTTRMGTGTWTLSGTGTVWTGAGTNIAGTSTIVLSDTSTAARTFAGGSLYYNKLTIGGATGTSTLTITGNNTFGELASTKTVAHTITSQATGTTTVGKWSVTGTVGNVVTLNTNSAGIAFTLSIAGPANSGIDYLSVRDCTVATTSPGEFYVGANSTNVSGNTRVIFTATPTPRTLYWVGGTGNWSDTNRWSLTSGVVAPAAIPTSLDAVIFNSASNATAYTATIDAGVTIARCAAFTMAGPASGNVTFAGTVGIAFHGNVSFAATGITRTYTGAMQWAGNSSYTFTTNGLSMGGTATVTGVGATWTLGSPFTIQNDLAITYGTFNTSGSNHAVSCGFFNSNNNNVRGATLNGSTITVTSSSPAVNFATPGNFSFSAGTSQLNISSSIAALTGGGVTFNNVSFTSATATSVVITGANTYNTLSFAGRTSVGITPVTFSANQTITTLTLNAGTAAAFRTFLASDTGGTQRTLSVGSLTAGAADIDFRDIAVTGAAAPIAPTRAGDCKGNSGVTFPAAKTVYYRQTGSSSWGTTGTGSWSATSGGGFDATQFPLAQDTAIFPAATYPASGSSTTLNANYNIGTIDMSLRTANTMSLGVGTNTPAIYGNWVNGTGTTITGSGRITFAGRGAQTLRSEGKTFSTPITLNSLGGTLTLQDGLTLDAGTTNNTLQLLAGTFDANGYNVTAAGAGAYTAFGTSGALSRTVAIGSGTWTFAGSGASWSVTGSNFTATGSGTLSFTNASAKGFSGGGFSYPSVTINQGGAGDLSFTGNNTFYDITNTYSGTGATSLSFGTSTQRLTQFSATGTAGRVLTISGTSAGSPAILVLTTPVPTGVDYINVSNVRGYQLTNTWNIGANSTNSGSLGFFFTSGGNTYFAAVSESATASDVVAAVRAFFASINESVSASDLAAVVASVFRANTTDTVRGSEQTVARVTTRPSVSEATRVSDVAAVAASVFKATAQEQVTAQDVTNVSGTYNPTIAEAVRGSDAAATVVIFPVSVSDTTRISDANTAGFTASTAVSESTRVSEATSAGLVLTAFSSEAARAADQTAVAPSVFSAIAMASAQALAELAAPGSVYNAIVPVQGAGITDSFIGAYLWNNIDDEQTPNWGTIPTLQTPGWTDVVDSQNPGWTDIPT